MGCLTTEQFDLLRRAAAPSTDLAAWWRHIDTCDACARRIVEGTRRFGGREAVVGPDDPTSAAPIGDAPTSARPADADGASANALTARAVPPVEPLPTVPGCDLIRELHRGAQGVVYLAIQRSTNRDVAVKVMLQGPFASPSDRARFEREVSILARLEHPNIVTIHDSGDAHGAHFFVMRYVPGVALDAWLKNNRDDRDRILRLFIEICDAVEAAHALGVVHRDLKPGNIRVTPDDRPAVLDFGLAKMAEGGGMDAVAMTQTGQFMGSVPWASPEQAAGDVSRIGSPSDVYALGVMLYQALTGAFPYSVEGNVRDVLDRVRFAEPQRPSAVLRKLSSGRGSARPAPIDRELDTIVLKCLRKESERRYASAGALADDLRRYLAGESIVARSDSSAYVAAARTRRFVRRNPLVASLAGVAIATAVALVLGIPLAYHWTPAQRWFERVAFASAPALRAPRLDHVVVVEFHRDIDLDALARVSGVERAADPNDRFWLRAVHGSLLKRLSSARPAAVVFNITFFRESPYDADLVEGVRQLGAPLVIALPSWSDEDVARLSRPIAAVAALGCEPSGFGARGWTAYIAIARGDGEPLRSLALQAYVLSRQPANATNEVRVERRDDVVEVRYWSATPVGTRRQSLGVQRVRIAAVRPPGPDTVGNNGILEHDEMASAILTMPSDAELAAATVRYEQIFSMSDDELFRRFAGRIVLIGDSRNPALHRPNETGGQRWSTYGHAAAIEQLINGAGVVVPGRWDGRLVTVGFSALGLLAGRRRPDGIAARAAMYVAAAIGCVATCLLALWLLSYLYSPVIAMLAFGVAAVFGELIHTARARGVGGPAGSGSSASWEVGP